MKRSRGLNRRLFLKAGAAASGGLLIGFCFPSASRAVRAASSSEKFSPNAWIRVGTDSEVTIIVDKSEMGQGVMTSLPMLVAEELEADWEKIRVEPAPADPAYKNTLLGQQATGGSTSVRSSWRPLREAGAAAREMLIAAAARTWGVTPQSCRAAQSTVIHPASGRRLSYGRLAQPAADLPVPKNVTLKPRSAFTRIGKPVKRLDTLAKSTGRARFGIDVKVSGMLVALVARCPVFGGKAGTLDAARASAIKGVRRVLRVSSGIAVVADGFWEAKKGREALEIRWKEGPNAGLSTPALRLRFASLAKEAGIVAASRGDAAAALARSPQKIEAVYEVPFLAHATMEPMNCTAHVRPDGCDVWVGTQAQTAAQMTAAKITGLPPSAIHIHTTYLGGGFGRRFEQDFLAEAVEISKAVGAPVKVIWTREDDMGHDFYRPSTYNVLSAGLDARGAPVAWTHRIVAPSIMSRVFPRAVRGGLDPSSVEGAADLPYEIPNLSVDYVMADTPVPVGFWRSVGSSQNAFITECFLDELAALARRAPYEFRRSLLAGHSRHLAVLDLAADRAGWGRPLPRGRFRGLAVHQSFGSTVAQVAEISVAESSEVRVHRVVCAADCGTVVNPAILKAQMESGIVFGLTAALKGAITLRDGRVEQGNFDDYALLRLEEMPAVEVHFVPGREAPGGAGEPGTPPIAPAVVNAIFAATGKRVRTLPIRPEALKKA